jgi:hypothetical protein
MQRALPIFLAVTSVITNNERLYGPPPDRPARPLAHAMKSSRAAQRSDNQLDRARVLEVRIHLPPAEAYHSFIGEVEALNTTTIRRLTPSCRHQLLVSDSNVIKLAQHHRPKLAGGAAALALVESLCQRDHPLCSAAITSAIAP